MQQVYVLRTASVDVAHLERSTGTACLSRKLRLQGPPPAPRRDASPKRNQAVTLEHPTAAQSDAARANE
eukprot:364708-Chlamydomonas_euryale.AAC.11